jgi:hypothetical protein
LSFGTIAVFQNGTSSPSISRESFSKYNLSAGGVPTFLQRIYLDVTASPYASTGAAGGQENTLYRSPLGLLLLNYASYNNTKSTASAVARRVEGNFDAATLSAFARAPEVANVTVVTSTSKQLWAYNHSVLVILLIPLVATILALLGNHRPEGKETRLQYDPMRIAARGLVLP